MNTNFKVMLAHGYAGQDPTGWWMSEKLDGVRAVWNGKELVTRNGKPIAAPESFLAHIPNTVSLDGELWIGRGAFQAVVGAVRCAEPDPVRWAAVKYMVFDAITDGAWEARMALLNCAVMPKRAGGVCLPVEQVRCSGPQHMQAVYQERVAAGAEGIMLRAPGSLYEQGRSGHLLKYKPTDQYEAVVIGHAPGGGKHTGRLGALRAKWHGVEFNIGTGLSDAVREAPPRVGAVVTFSCNGLTDAGVPRFPAFVAVRNYE